VTHVDSQEYWLEMLNRTAHAGSLEHWLRLRSVKPHDAVVFLEHWLRGV